MLRTNAATEELGIRLMLVHAKNEEAGRWYRGFGFEESPTDPLHLMLLMNEEWGSLAGLSIYGRKRLSQSRAE